MVHNVTPGSIRNGRDVRYLSRGKVASSTYCLGDRAGAGTACHSSDSVQTIIRIRKWPVHLSRRTVALHCVEYRASKNHEAQEDEQAEEEEEEMEPGPGSRVGRRAIGVLGWISNPNCLCLARVELPLSIVAGVHLVSGVDERKKQMGLLADRVVPHPLPAFSVPMDSVRQSQPMVKMAATVVGAADLASPPGPSAPHCARIARALRRRRIRSQCAPTTVAHGRPTRGRDDEPSDELSRPGFQVPRSAVGTRSRRPSHRPEGCRRDSVPGFSTSAARFCPNDVSRWAGWTRARPGHVAERPATSATRSHER